MKTCVAAGLVMCVLLARPVSAAENEAVAQASQAAKQWLALTDSGQYAKSWTAAASIFRSAVTKPDWERALQSVRSPLGAFKSRRIKSATFTRTLPGAPDGEYVVIRYDAQFENMPAAIETVTPTHEKDGSWRVSGYFIK